MQQNSFAKSLKVLDSESTEDASYNMKSNTQLRVLVGDFYYEGRIAYDAESRLVTVFDDDDKPIGCMGLEAVSVIEPPLPQAQS